MMRTCSKYKFPAPGALFLLALVVLFPELSLDQEEASTLDTGDTAWMLTSSALVLMMTIPGLFLFYGGLVRSKNALGTMMHSFFLAGLITIQWAIIGYSLAFGTDISSLVGGLDFFGLNGVGPEPLDGSTIPHSLFMVYQMTFAIITVALISGAFAERMKFSAFILFSLLWTTIIYDPLAHWVWGGGWIGAMGALDFWVGWFGFNAGSALGANGLAATAFMTTQLAAAAAVVAWTAVEWIVRGKPTVLGAASGAVAGLVAITPAAGFVGPMSAIIIGIGGGVLCFFGVTLKPRLGYDDALDVVGVHGVGGTWGALATGLFASTAVNPDGANGLFFGNPEQLWIQFLSVAVTWVFSFVGTSVILLLVKAVMGLRVSSDKEPEGLDISEHGEEAYGGFQMAHGYGTPEYGISLKDE